MCVVAPCGIQRIDELMSPRGESISPIGPGETDRDAVGVIQDLLTGHGESGLPNLLSAQYGVFGPLTAGALGKFCAQHGLPQTGHVDAQTLHRLVEMPARTPIACRAYLTLVLDLPFTGLTKILSIVAQMEGAGKFAALNFNTDGAGLSFGLIQWAQRPGRLSEILSVFSEAHSAEFTRIFGAGDPALAQALIAHTRKRSGGVDATTGETMDPAFELMEEPWVGRFRQAALVHAFQVAQVQTAVAAFSRSWARIRQFASGLQSERSVAFLLDMANQFGDGAVRSMYQAVKQDGMSEGALLKAMTKQSLRRIQSGFQRSTQTRRENLLMTSFLLDSPFEDIVPNAAQYA